MFNKTFVLVGTLFLTTGLIGCQSLQSSYELQNPEQQLAKQKVSWDKKGRLFESLDETVLGSSLSRVVFFRDSEDSKQDGPIYLQIGPDNMFQASLKGNYYSDVVVCSGQQNIKVTSLMLDNEKVSSSSNIYNLPAQQTTYFKVSLSALNQPIIEQVAPQNAIAQLSTMLRQSYQISRVSMVCDTEPTVIEKPVIKMVTEQSEKPIAYSVNFNFNADTIADNNYSKFEGLANFINSYPKADVILEGHTDSVGSDAYNQKLSKIRAEKVKTILVKSYAIDAERLSTVGYGETKPIDTNETEAGRLNNRRVVAIITQ